MNMSRDAVGFHSEISDRFAGRYTDSSRFEDRLRVWRDALAPLSPRAFAVDLGCGPGDITKHLVDVSDRVLAVDGSPEMIELCRQTVGPAAEFLCSRLETLDPDVLAGADLITLSSVVEYLEDPTELLASVSRAAVPGAVVFVSIPNRASIYRRMEWLAFRVTRRPTYLRFVQSTLRPSQLAVGSLRIGDVRHLSPAPFCGRLARRLGLQRWFDTLVLVELVNDASN